MNLKEQIIVSLGKKIWGFSPIDCEYMRDSLEPLSEEEAKEVYKTCISKERITLNAFAEACRKIKDDAVLKHEVEAKELLEKLHLLIEKINYERKINNFIQGQYPLSQMHIGDAPAFSEYELNVLRSAHKTYKELVQYREYERVIDNLRYISMKFWLAGLSNGYKAIKHNPT